MNSLRLKLADQSVWDSLKFEFNGEEIRLFGKHRTKAAKAAQAEALKPLSEAIMDINGPWRWKALDAEVSRQLEEAMNSFAGNPAANKPGLVARVAHFVWPLIGKSWQWNKCEESENGEQSLLICIEDANAAEQNIAGMRGLNMRRIELFQEFRRCCQHL